MDDGGGVGQVGGVSWLESLYQKCPLIWILRPHIEKCDLPIVFCCKCGKVLAYHATRGLWRGLICARQHLGPHKRGSGFLEGQDTSLTAFGMFVGSKAAAIQIHIASQFYAAPIWVQPIWSRSLGWAARIRSVCTQLRNAALPVPDLCVPAVA